MSAGTAVGDDRAVAAPVVLFGHGLAVREIATPVGLMRLVATPAGLCSARFISTSGSEPVASSGVDSETVRAREHVDHAAEHIGGYFRGREMPMALDIDYGSLRGFSREVLDSVRRIRYGRVATYAEMAAFAGNPSAARAAGSVLGANPLCVVIPCHRVVPRVGGLGGYSAGAAVKEQLLRREGVTFR